jgi:hypothetical protein
VEVLLPLAARWLLAAARRRAQGDQDSQTIELMDCATISA